MFFVVQIMPDNLDPVILSKLQPHAQQLAMALCKSTERRTRKQLERTLTRSLWDKAYREGLTTFAAPPILVSLFCRALWSVVWYLAQQVLNRKAD